MWRKLIPWWRPLRMQTLAGLLLLLCATFVELLLPWPMKFMVDHVLGDHALPEYAARFLPAFAAGDRASLILPITLAVIVLAVLHRAFTFAGQLVLIRVGGLLVLQLRRRGYEQFCRLSLSYHDKTKVGDSLYRIAYDTQAAMTLISGALVPVIQGIIMLSGIIAILLRMDLLLTLIAAAIGPLFLLCIRIFGRKIDEESKSYHQSESSIVSTVQESLSTMRAVQAFTREPDTSLRFGNQARESFQHHLGLIKSQLIFAAVVGLVMAAGTASAIWFGAHRALSGSLSAGDVLVFLSYLGMLYQPFNAFSQSASAIQSTRTQLQRVFEVLDAAPEIADRPGARTLKRARGDVEFRSVAFEYEPDRPVLRDVSFRASPGEVVALVGPTGAGKTTLASLLLRFYDPAQGAVLVDGHDLRDLELCSLRRQVSVVLQDALLLSGTIRDNIAYGRPDATAVEVEEAARKAQAHDFITSLPEGYETNLAERAVNMSGGQKQRIAIARAFLKDAPILVMDEPTSALDTNTEAALLDALRTLIKGRTTLIIAHRLSTVSLANRIIVLRDGRVAEQGSHEELMQRRGAYYDLCKMR
jgi:ATP-binding cassette, subfamily B, bacterial